MYQAHFKLHKNPFAMTPDPASLFKTPAHREALAGLTYAVLNEKGFLVLTGEAGTGKTTVISRMLRFIPPSRALFSVVLNPTLSSSEFLEAALLDFGMEDLPATKVRRLLLLQQFVTAAHDDGKTCVLVVDEAHKLSAEVLEEIRLLTNFENSERKLLQIILAGQDELRDVLNRKDMRQVKQRIALRFELRPLTDAETSQYIRFRWMNAGGKQEPPFDQEAIEIITRSSRGIPRVINALCDNALVLIYGTGEATVTELHVRQVLRDLDMTDIDEAPRGPKNIVAMDAMPRGLQSLGLSLSSREPAPSQPRRLLAIERGVPESRPSLLMRCIGKLKPGRLERAL